MLIFVLGMVGVGSEFYERYIIRATNLDRAALDADTVEPIEEYFQGRAKSAIVIARAPSQSLAEFIGKQSPQPTLFIWRDPKECVIRLMRYHQIDFEHALRSVSLSCAALAPLALSQNVLKIKIDSTVSRQHLLIERIQRYLCDWGILETESAPTIDIDDLQGRNSDASRLVGGRRPIGFHAPATDDVRLNNTQVGIVDKVLGAYASLFEDDIVAPMVWPPDIFFLGDDQERAPTSSIDITGYRRGLVFGPYLYLPKGRWIGTVPVAIASDALQETFNILIVIDERDIIEEAIIEPQQAGIFKVSIEFAVHDPATKVEFRIQNSRACFEGHIALGDVSLTPA